MKSTIPLLVAKSQIESKLTNFFGIKTYAMLQTSNIYHKRWATVTGNKIMQHATLLLMRSFLFSWLFVGFTIITHHSLSFFFPIMYSFATIPHHNMAKYHIFLVLWYQYPNTIRRSQIKIEPSIHAPC